MTSNVSRITGVGDLLAKAKADLDRYERGDLWYPATRQRVVDLIEAVEEMQRVAEALGYELEHAAKSLARHQT